MKRSDGGSWRAPAGGWLLAATAAVITLFVVLGAMRGALSRVVGDEGTYLAMAASVALDGDLRFGDDDLERVLAAEAGGRKAVILQRADGEVSYSKPPLFAIVAAPFYRLAGDAGVVILNLLALAAAAVLVWGFARRLGPELPAGWTVLTFLGAGALVPYLVYRTSDLLQAALAIAGAVLAVAGARPPAGDPQPRNRLQRWLDARWAPWVGGVLLGALGVTRYPNFMVAIGIVGALLLTARWKRAIAVAAGALVATAALAVLGEAATGTVNAYKADRATFNNVTGYPESADDPGFGERRATQRLSLKPIVRPRVTAYSTLYYFLGRHTGILFYFPAVLALALTVGRRNDALGGLLAASAAGAVVFYLVWMPENYFGGATFIGNRYFLPIYALLLVALPRLPSRRALAVTWAVAVVVGVSALLSAARTRDLGGLSQSHAFAGVFRRLPFESTARAIDGRRDRYWSGDFLRFQDPYARVEGDGWWLSSTRPASDVEIVTRHPIDRLDLLVRSPDGDVELAVSDWASRATLAVERTGDGPGRLVSIEPSDAWRRHRFWWPPWETYDARVVRIGVRAAEARDVEVRYLGTTLDGMFDTRVHSASVPERVAAGSRSTVALRVRNMSHYPWYRRGVVPVQLVHWLSRPPSPLPIGELVRTELPHDVISGDPVDLELAVQWPDEPGRYRLTFDLQFGELVRFEERIGEPLLVADVEVVAALD